MSVSAYLHAELHLAQAGLGFWVRTYELTECSRRVSADAQVVQHALHFGGELSTAPKEGKVRKGNEGKKSGSIGYGGSLRRDGMRGTGTDKR